MLHRSSSNLSAISSKSDNKPLFNGDINKHNARIEAKKPTNNANLNITDYDQKVSHVTLNKPKHGHIHKKPKVSPPHSLFDKKKKPDILVVDQPHHGVDNSVVYLHPSKLTELYLSKGDTVLLKGRLHHTTVAIVLADESCEASRAKINRTIRKNLRVCLGDLITIQPKGIDIPFGSRVHVLPIEDTIQNISGDLFDVYLKPYFLDAYRPVKKGDFFTIQKAMHTVEVSLTCLLIKSTHR